MESQRHQIDRLMKETKRIERRTPWIMLGASLYTLALIALATW